MQHYPVLQPLDPMLQHPDVATPAAAPSRLNHGVRESTRQVEITFLGDLPGVLDLGVWETFSVRSYTPEPLLCFKCQGFEHVQRHCGG